jgi:hypothetical protein
MKINELLKESFEDWNNGTWVHYTDFNMLKFNPSPSYQDPVAIYFFPETFTPVSYWTNKKNKFVITLKPSARILDYGNITNQQLDNMLVATNAKEKFEAYVKEYPPKDSAKKGRMAWEMMKNSMVLSANAGGKARWNTIIRNLGWDAIFDDTGAIHSAEVQLMVLDPAIIASIAQQDNSIKGFGVMKNLIDHQLVPLFSQYGEVTVDEPKSERENKYDRKSPRLLRAQIIIEKSPKNYASLQLKWEPTSKNYKNLIDISVRWSMPNLGYGSGARYDISKGKFDSFSDLERLKTDLDKIFTNNTDQK